MTSPGFPYDQTNPVALLYADAADPTQMVQRLQGVLSYNSSWLRVYDAYFEGEQQLQYMSASMVKEVGDLIRPVILNWCRLVVRAYAARIGVQGFRYAGDEKASDDLWAVWQANNLDSAFRQVLTERLALGRGAMIVGSPDEPGGEPVVTVESPHQVAWIRDPRTRKVAQAAKYWYDLDYKPWATLYEPMSTTTLRLDNGWQVVERDDHQLGRVPVVPFVNHERILRPNGRAEFHDVMPIVDAAIKMATDMMTAGEFHAMPRRWITGMTDKDFIDQNGNKVSPWSRVAGRLWSSGKDTVKFGQFPEAMLTNFHESIKLLAQTASQVSGLPPGYLSFATINPASADSVREFNNQTVMYVEQEHHPEIAESIEEVMRLVIRLKTGAWDPRAESLETIFTDPQNQTPAQLMDALVKGVQSGILPVQVAREQAGFGPLEIARMDEMDQANAAQGLQALQDSLNPQPQQPSDGSAQQF